jgi:hypothetical protein
MSDQFPGIGGARTLLTALAPAQYELFRVPPPATRTPFRLGAPPGGKAQPLILPFSSAKIWSIVVIDEGAPVPAIGHFKYVWALDHAPFRTWAERRGIVAAQLTLAKLERLMRRLRGVPWRTFEIQTEATTEVSVGQQLDYPEAEWADVVDGLSAFATCDACARRLAACYARLPASCQVFGTQLGDGTAAGVRAALRALPAKPKVGAAKTAL